MNVEYDNGEPSTAMNKKVKATVESQKQLNGYAGPGSERVHVEYPKGPQGAQTYEYVDRYRYGIVFSFKATGRVYSFDFFHLVCAPDATPPTRARDARAPARRSGTRYCSAS